MPGRPRLTDALPVQEQRPSQCGRESTKKTQVLAKTRHTSERLDVLGLRAKARSWPNATEPREAMKTADRLLLAGPPLGLIATAWGVRPHATGPVHAAGLLQRGFLPRTVREDRGVC